MPNIGRATTLGDRMAATTVTARRRGSERERNGLHCRADSTDHRGVARGIGRMIATGCVGAGARVYVSSRKADACAETAAALSEGGECIALPADLSRESECRRLADALTEREPGLDILVNNAGANWY